MFSLTELEKSDFVTDLVNKTIITNQSTPLVLTTRNNKGHYVSERNVEVPAGSTFTVDPLNKEVMVKANNPRMVTVTIHGPIEGKKENEDISFEWTYLTEEIFKEYFTII